MKWLIKTDKKPTEGSLKKNVGASSCSRAHKSVGHRLRIKMDDVRASSWSPPGGWLLHNSCSSHPLFSTTLGPNSVFVGNSRHPTVFKCLFLLRPHFHQKHLVLGTSWAPTKRLLWPTAFSSWPWPWPYTSCQFDYWSFIFIFFCAVILFSFSPSCLLVRFTFGPAIAVELLIFSSWCWILSSISWFINACTSSLVHLQLSHPSRTTTSLKFREHRWTSDVFTDASSIPKLLNLWRVLYPSRNFSGWRKKTLKVGSYRKLLYCFVTWYHKYGVKQLNYARDRTASRCHCSTSESLQSAHIREISFWFCTMGWSGNTSLIFINLPLCFE